MFVDANAIARWIVPTGMTSHVHAFEGREGGTFRVSLTCDAPTGVGKTTAHTDTYHGRFVKLVPNERVVEVVEFETADPALQRGVYADPELNRGGYDFLANYSSGDLTDGDAADGVAEGAELARDLGRPSSSRGSTRSLAVAREDAPVS